MKKADPRTALEVIDRLKARKAELDQLDDQLSILISEIEDALRSLKLGVRFSIPIRKTHEWVQLLSFDKFEVPHGQGKWRLLREGYAPHDEKETWTQIPLLDCPREQRYEAVSSHVAPLVDAAVAALEEKVGSRREALSHGKSVLKALHSVAGVAK